MYCTMVVTVQIIRTRFSKMKFDNIDLPNPRQYWSPQSFTPKTSKNFHRSVTFHGKLTISSIFLLLSIKSLGKKIRRPNPLAIHIAYDKFQWGGLNFFMIYSTEINFGDFVNIRIRTNEGKWSKDDSIVYWCDTSPPIWHNFDMIMANPKLAVSPLKDFQPNQIFIQLCIYVDAALTTPNRSGPLTIGAFCI